MVNRCALRSQILHLRIANATAVTKQYGDMGRMGRDESPFLSRYVLGGKGVHRKWGLHLVVRSLGPRPKVVSSLWVIMHAR